MNGLLNYFMPGEVGGMPTMGVPQTGLGGYFSNPLAIAGLTMLAANRGPNQGQAVPLGLQALQGQQRFNLLQQQAEEEKKQRDEERRLRALERARLEEARAAQERVLPEMLGLPSTYRGTTTQTMPGMEYATPTGDVSSPYTAQFQTQRMPDTEVQVPTFNREQYLQDLARSGYGAKMLEAQLAREKKSPFGQVDPSKYTPASLAEFEKTGNWEVLDPIDKPNKPTAFIQNYEYARDAGYRGTPEDWQKLNVITQQQFLQPYRDIETQLQQQESLYKYGPPKSTGLPKEVSLQDVADTAKASGKTTQQVIDDLKKRGIKVRGAK